MPVCTDLPIVNFISPCYGFQKKRRIPHRSTHGAYMVKNSFAVHHASVRYQPMCSLQANQSTKCSRYSYRASLVCPNTHMNLNPRSVSDVWSSKAADKSRHA